MLVRAEAGMFQVAPVYRTHGSIVIRHQHTAALEQGPALPVGLQFFDLAAHLQQYSISGLTWLLYVSKDLQYTPKQAYKLLFYMGFFFVVIFFPPIIMCSES